MKICELGMKMGMMNIFPLLLTLYHKLVLWEGIFGTAGSVIPFQHINYNQVTLCKQLLFQQTFFLPNAKYFSKR